MALLVGGGFVQGSPRQIEFAFKDFWIDGSWYEYKLARKWTVMEIWWVLWHS